MSCLPSSRSDRKSENFTINRRRLIGGLGAGCLGLVAAPAIIAHAFAQTRRWTADPFSLGVASGAPRPDGFVLWTRLAPDPLSANPACKPLFPGAGSCPRYGASIPESAYSPTAGAGRASMTGNNASLQPSVPSGYQATLV